MIPMLRALITLKVQIKSCSIKQIQRLQGIEAKKLLKNQKNGTI